ncbi:MAG: hypothetical protein QM296_03335 [Bacillota bacterium]|nr:hypothetical protein [Bacillota bacterium]
MAVLSTEEFHDLMASINSHLYSELKEANEGSRLFQILSHYKLDAFLPRTHNPQPNHDAWGKIVLVGHTQARSQQIKGAFESMGISFNRVDCYFSDDINRFRIQNYQHNRGYCLILFGPMPHSVTGMSGASSGIAWAEQEPGFPHCIRVSNQSGELEINKSSIKRALQSAIEDGYIERDLKH